MHGKKSPELMRSILMLPVGTAPFDEVATRQLLRKLDIHLIPFLALLYLLCFLDRSNIGNARLIKLEEDLDLKGIDFNIALAFFFPFYVLAEIPSNVLLKQLRPSIWLTIITVTWGIVMILTGLVRNLNELLVCRALLGIAEGGLFPGVSFLITMWYRRRECGLRIALFFSAATAAGAFGGLLARGMSEMSGIGNKAGWSWIFILEGLLTLINEKIEVQRRLLEDDGSSNEVHIKFFYQALRDGKIWVMMIITIGIFTPLYSISLFLPTIINQLGYSSNKTQLLSIPPYLVACLCTIIGNFAADRSGQRGLFVLGFEVIAIIGFLMLVTSGLPHVQYAGSFFAASGIYPLVPLVTTWTSNNIGGSFKRCVGLAMQVGFGNLGGALAGFVYLPQDQPRQVCNSHPRYRPTMLSDKKIQIGLRMAQLVFAFVILVISSSIDQWTLHNAYYGTHAASPIGFLIFVPIFSFLSAAYLQFAPRFLPRNLHPTALHRFTPLILICVNALFYISGFIALAVYLSNLNYCRGAVCDAARADCFLSAIAYLAYVTEAVMTGSAMIRHQRGAQMPLKADYEDREDLEDHVDHLETFQQKQLVDSDETLSDVKF
ncbi:hypothetical protein K3495_g6004 [Podosphaera aphanis]|nr:hypothetical protein K3495_g6004 [Podosphaera aphanis]